MGIIFDFDLYEFCTNFSERFTTCILSRFVRIFLNLNALLRVCYLDLYEFDLYDLFGERFSRTNRGIAVVAKNKEVKISSFREVQSEIIFEI